MKKFVNARFPVIVVLALVGGILLGYFFIRTNISLFYIIAIVPVAAIIFVLCFVFSKKKLLIFSVFAIVFFTVGMVGSFLKLDKFGAKELVNGDSYTISATVCDKGKYNGGEYIVVNQINADGKKINGKIKVYLSSAYGEYCNIGYKVKFTAKINTYDTFPYGKLNYNTFENIKYNCYISSGLSSNYRFSLFGSVNNAIRGTLYKNLDYDTASIAYAMLTGNTDGIEDGSIGAFRYGGIAHIFAVSGLHIGIIYGFLRLLCKKLHLNKYLTFVICILPLFLYSGVCGFTLSSVRALIMCAVAMLARIIFAKYDALNSLSLAAIVILLINPLSLFNVGFQLSVSAVGAIILLSRNIVRPFKKVPQKLKDTVGVSLSAQAGTVPIMLAKFGYLSGAGILLNIIIVPLLSAFFAIIFVATFLSLIAPFAAQYILPYAAMPLEATVSFLTAAGFEKAAISGFGAGAFVVVYYIALFLLSDKFNIKWKYRLISVACAVTFLCAYVPLKMFSPFNGYQVIASAYYGGGEVLFKSKDAKILVITEDINLSRNENFLSRYYSPNIDTLIIVGGNDCVTAYTTDFKCDAYIYDGYVNVQPYTKKTVHYENSFSLGGINFEFADGYSLKAEYRGVTVGICAGNYIPFDYCDYMFTDSRAENAAKTIVSFNERNLDNCIYDYGDFIFKIKS